MCIICIKPAGIKMPSTEEITNCFESNPHGAGYMFAHNGKVHIRKGFFKVPEMEQSFMETEKIIGTDLDSLPIVLHMRLATSGKVNKSNCHPFPNSHKQKWLKRTNIFWDIGVAHNGVAPYRCEMNEFSDTQMFIIKVLWKYSFQEMIDNKDMIFPPGFNKFAIMNSNGEVLEIGDFQNDDEGRRWSNWGYKYNRSAFYGYYMNTFNGDMGWDERYDLSEHKKELRKITYGYGRYSNVF
jgi:hypothetical protein